MAIENVFQKSRLLTGLWKKVDCKKGCKYKLLERLQPDRLRTLSKQLGEYFEEESINLDETIYRFLQRPCSAFIFAHKVPSLNQNIVSSIVIVDQTNQRSLHCVLAVVRYYSCNVNGFVTVMVEADEERYLAQSCKKKWFCGLRVYSYY